MSEPIRIFVGTDPRMGDAEKVLEHTIRKHTEAEVEFYWMRAGDDGFVVQEDSGLVYKTTQGRYGPEIKVDTSWGIGREPGKPYGVGRQGKPRWATDFTCFRWFVPEFNGFKGFAIYLDVDMMVLGDIQELYDYRQPGKLVSTQRPDVFVVDCEAFATGWPRIREGKESGWGMGAYTEQLRRSGRWVKGGIPSAWDSLDRLNPDSKLVHFTNMRTQPWRPWPEVFDYDARPHPDPKACERFFAELEAAS